MATTVAHMTLALQAGKKFYGLKKNNLHDGDGKKQTKKTVKLLTIQGWLYNFNIYLLIMRNLVCIAAHLLGLGLEICPKGAAFTEF